MNDKSDKLASSTIGTEATASFAEKNPQTVKKLSKDQLVYSLAGLILGTICILGGIILLLNGIAGSISWTAKFIGAESELNDAAPGAVLFIAGLFVVLITRYIFKIK